MLKREREFATKGSRGIIYKICKIIVHIIRGLNEPIIKLKLIIVLTYTYILQLQIISQCHFKLEKEETKKILTCND